MPIRPIREADLEAMAALADRGLEFDEINLPLIREKTIGAADYREEFGLLFEEDGRVAGFLQGALGRPKDGVTSAYVRLLVVDRAHRMKGFGSALLTEFESRARAAGASAVSIMDCPSNYLMPGLDFRYTEGYCFLLRHKYEYFRENHNLLCPLDATAWPELDEQVAGLAADGIDVRRAALADRDSINAFLDEHWASWKYEVGGALENDPPSLFIAQQEGKTIAFSGYQGNNKSLSWFGPMGTKPGLRGKGLGAILLRLCLRELARQGWPTAIIPWVGPTRFYARFCQARLDRCFWVFRKQL